MTNFTFPARYEACRRLGTGGGGEVWEVKDRYTSEHYALKVLAENATEHEMAALVREATALSGLEGLGVPRVLRFGRLSRSGRPYMVRELIEGVSLEELIASAVPSKRVLSALARAAEQLTLVHRAGFFHGDVKPANIIVGQSGGDERVTLVDLGLAAPWRDAGITAPGLTPRYAAPELLSGKPLTVRAEVYALGVAVREIIERSSHSLSAVTVRDLLQVSALATAAEPEQRYPSADEFANALLRAAGIERAETQVDPTLIWPIVGIEATASRLLQWVVQLSPGEVLELRGEPGSGRTVLLRRLAWSLGVEGRPLVWIDETCNTPESMRAELDAVLPAQPWLLVDDAEELCAEARQLISQAQAAGAVVVIVGALDVPGSHSFAIPPLGEHIAIELLRRAVPSLTDRMAKLVAVRTGGLPGRLKQFVVRLAHRTLASDDEVEELLSGLESAVTPDSFSNPLDRALFLLARGRYADAKRALEEVNEGDPLVIAVAWARLWVGLGNGQEALARIDVAKTEAERRAGSEQALAWYVWRARTLIALAQYTEALAVLHGLGPIAGATGAEALSFEGVAHMHMGDEALAKAAIERAIEQAQALSDARVEGVALACLGLVLQRSQAQVDRAQQAYERALVCAQQAADAGTIGTVQLNLAVLLKVRGDVARAIELFEAAVDMGRRSGRRGTVRTALLGLANADLYVGRLARARTSIEALEQQKDNLGVVAEGQFYGLQAEYLARSGDVAGAAKAYAQCAAVFERLGKTLDAAEARLESVLVRSQAPDPDVAELVADLRTAQAQLQESHAHKGLVCMATARVLVLQGDDAAARDALEAGLTASREASQREWTWQILATRAELEEVSGQLLMARRDRVEAVTVLEEIAARLPRDLREVFWNDARRRALRNQVSLSLGSAETHMAYPTLPREAGFGRSRISVVASTLLEQRLARILEINRELLGELDLDRLSARVIDLAVEMVRAERGCVILRDAQGQLTVRSSSSREGDGHQQFSRSIAERVLASREAFVTSNARDDMRMREFSSVHQMAIESVACVPIVARFTDPIGALYVESRRKISAGFEAEIPTLQAFADQVAIAIETARLVSENRARAEELAAANAELRTAQASLRELLGERTEKLKLARQRLRETQDTLYGHFGYQGMVGTSERMRRCYSLIDRVKDTDVPVLITGESGTGKEVAARALHRASERAKHPFLGVNCGAIPEHLLESELFGHVRGAFTGADRDRKGLIREAQNGTVLLDEIGEMPQKMQAGLLRVLQERKVRPVGGTAEEPVNCRFIFATHRNLRELVEAGKFREDLFYRIHVVELPLPPLRDRLDDVPLLVDHFFGIFAARYKRDKKTLTRAALRRLAGYNWPGNVRQLEHILLNAWVLSDEPELDVEDLELPHDARPLSQEPRSFPPQSLAPSIPAYAAEPRAVISEAPPSVPVTERTGLSKKPPLRKETTSSHRRSEKDRILEALEACNWNRVKAAELSGIPRRTFYRRLREYNIQ